MHFPTEDEEGGFSLGAGGRSRLSSLFQGESTMGDVNQALTFQAPKQPKKHDSSQSTAGVFKLIHAAAVHAYKLKDGNYVNQGKLGCAILGIHESESYKLLLYKGKQVQVTSTTIVPSFKFQVQPHNYINFYDEKNENWSINLDSETALIDLAKQIALAKANCESKNRTTLIVQDLLLGEGPYLENGDAAEVKYTGWLLTNYSFGQVFDSNTNSESVFRFRLGKSKVIKGWSEGLLGAQKGTKRLLIVPPSLAYGSEGVGSSVPPNSTLIFEAHVTKVKVSRESSHSPTQVPESIPEKKPEIPHKPSISSQDENIRMRGASISEQLSQSPKKDKAQLISRMAKMGTATLLLPGAMVAHISSESENEEEIQEEPPLVQQSDSRTSSPKLVSKPNTRSNSVASNAAQSVEHSRVVQDPLPLQVTQQTSQISMFTQAAMPTQQTYMQPQSSGFPYQPQMGSPFHVPQAQFQMPAMLPPTSVADTHLPLLLSETRSQNTEVRMGLSKIVDKVDTVIQKVDDLRLQQGRGIGQAAFMDSALILQNIERIVQENRQLKEDVDMKNSKIQALNEKVCDLLQRSQRFFEESNSMLEQKSDSIQAVSSQSQAKIMALEQEKTKLTTELTETTTKLAIMNSELLECQRQLVELKQKQLDYEKATGDNNDLNSENNTLLSSLQNQLQVMEGEKSALTTKLAEKENQCKELKDSNLSLNKLVDENKVIAEDLKEKYATQLSEMKSSNKNTSQNKAELELKTENKQLIEEKEKLLTQIQERDKKYEILYSKTRIMKEQFERMSDTKQLQATSSGPTDYSGEIKKMMNTLYKLLQGKFESETSYTGSKVLEMALQSIRGLTFQMLQMKGRAQSKVQEVPQETGIQKSEEQNSPKVNSVEPSTMKENTSIKDVEKTTSEIQQNGLLKESDNSQISDERVSSSAEDTSGSNASTQSPLEVPKTGDFRNQEKDDRISNTIDPEKEVLKDEDKSSDAQIPPNNTKVMKEEQVQNRLSPDIWKPQPPPLFDDDDDDEEDDDDWLK